MQVQIEKSWKKVLATEFKKEYFTDLAKFVKQQYLEEKTIYPPPKFIFNAFKMTPFDQVKVVILGQDPYHGPRQAHGLSFSVPDNVRIPPSLRNIYKEIRSDLGISSHTDGNLECWAKQGILLLNATLTVEASKAGSHQNKGWEEFTDTVIEKLSSNKNNLVFMLWGSYAQKKGTNIDTTKHLVLKAPHPSPLSAHRGFFGCQHFSKCNHYLIKYNLESIRW